jgi:hypothetical protein
MYVELLSRQSTPSEAHWTLITWSTVGLQQWTNTSFSFLFLDSMIDWLIVYCFTFRLRNILLIWRCHHCRYSWGPFYKRTYDLNQKLILRITF